MVERDNGDRRVVLRHGLVESRMRGNAHVRFGGRAGETDRRKRRHRAPVRPNHLSYEVLCAEVADSVSWCRFARIAFGAPVPHPTTLMKITTRCGEATIAALNETLLAKAAQAKVLKLDKVRADTTVVEANVTYPTDSRLLAKAVGRIARLVERIHAAGRASRTKVADRRRAAGRRARDIAANLKLQRRRQERGATYQRRAGHRGRDGRH